MAGTEPMRARRVPYEWILGAMFVATFYLSESLESRIARAAWLVVVGLLAGRALGVRRKPDARPARFGVPLLVGAMGFAWYVSMFLVIDHKHSLSEEALHAALWLIRMTWFLPPALCLGSLVAAVARPGRYREFSVFLNAVFLLLFAWYFDSVLSGISCGSVPVPPSLARHITALALTAAPLVWAIGSAIRSWRRSARP